MTCGLCGKVRAHLPESIRARLVELEHRMMKPKYEPAPTAVEPPAPWPRQAGVETPRREDDEGDEDEETEAPDDPPTHAAEQQAQGQVGRPPLFRNHPRRL